jgi:hypothetical protein
MRWRSLPEVWVAYGLAPTPLISDSSRESLVATLPSCRATPRTRRRSMAEPSQELKVLREKIERCLKEILSGYEVRGELYAVRQGSSVTFIRPFDWREGATLVRLYSPVLEKVTKAGNERMFEEFSVLNDRFIFGKLYWTGTNEDKSIGSIYLEHMLLGEYLDADELKTALFATALTADEIDDELKAKFGGERWSD